MATRRSRIEHSGPKSPRKNYHFYIERHLIAVCGFKSVSVLNVPACRSGALIGPLKAVWTKGGRCIMYNIGCGSWSGWSTFWKLHLRHVCRFSGSLICGTEVRLCESRSQCDHRCGKCMACCLMHSFVQPHCATIVVDFPAAS